jgi:CheY-specific phosphatase CheX
MSSIMVQSLSQTTAATFEELALLFPEHDATPEQAESPLDVTVSVDFRGPFTGRLVLSSSASVLPAIAANMLGDASTRQPRLQRDALGELANVICGNVLPMIAGAEAVFNLSAPRIHDADESPSREGDEPCANVEFGVEDGRVSSTLYVFGGHLATATAA